MSSVTALLAIVCVVAAVSHADDSTPATPEHVTATPVVATDGQATSGPERHAPTKQGKHHDKHDKKHLNETEVPANKTKWVAWRKNVEAVLKANGVTMPPVGVTVTVKSKHQKSAKNPQRKEHKEEE